MTNSFLTTQKTPAKERGFQDEHLTVQDKKHFWTWPIQCEKDGKPYQSTILQMSRVPDCAKFVSDQYTRLCESILAVQKSEGKSSATSTEGVAARTKNDNPNAVAAANPVFPIKKSSSTTQIINNLACPSSDTIFCVCGEFLPWGNDGYCEDCWTYYTLYATTCKFEDDIKRFEAQTKYTQQSQQQQEVIDFTGDPASHVESASPCIAPSQKRKAEKMTAASDAVATLAKKIIRADNTVDGVDIRKQAEWPLSATTPKRNAVQISRRNDAKAAPMSSMMGIDGATQGVGLVQQAWEYDDTMAAQARDRVRVHSGVGGLDWWNEKIEGAQPPPDMNPEDLDYYGCKGLRYQARMQGRNLVQ